MNEPFDTTPDRTRSAPIHFDGGFSPGANAHAQAEHLARRLADGRAAGGTLYVRVPLRADGTPCTPELHDGGRVVGRLSARAVELLVEDGRLVLQSESKWRRTLALSPVTEQPVTEQPTQQPSNNDSEEPAMEVSTTDRGTVTLPPLGSRLSTHEVATLFGHSTPTNVTGYIRDGRLTAEKEDPDVERSPWRITVDEKLLGELVKRGIAYTIGEETCTEPAEADTDEDGTWTEQTVRVPPGSLYGTAGDGQDEEPLPPASNEEREAPATNVAREPVEVIAEDLQALARGEGAAVDRLALWTLEVKRLAPMARRTLQALHEAVEELEAAKRDVNRETAELLSGLGFDSPAQLRQAVAADEEED